MSLLSDVHSAYERLQDAKSHLRQLKADPNTSHVHIDLVTEQVRNCRRWLSGAQWTHAESIRRQNHPDHGGEESAVGKHPPAPGPQASTVYDLRCGRCHVSVRPVAGGLKEAGNDGTGMGVAGTGQGSRFRTRRPFSESPLGERSEVIGTRAGAAGTARVRGDV